MSHDYKGLLKVAYEIEGLLMLQAQRGNDAVKDVDTLLAEKISILADSFAVAAPSDIAVAEAIENFEQETPADSIATAVEPHDTDKTYDVSAKQATEEAPDSTQKDKIAETAEQEEIAASTIHEELMMADSPLSLEEKLARERARDIFKAFTLNDKFRFRRELFRDSQEEFDDALNVISQMSTVEEAEEYIYDDLCLDASNEDVKAFMDVVKKHF